MVTKKTPTNIPGLVGPPLVPLADPGDPGEDGLAAVDVLDGALPEEEVDVVAVREGPHEIGGVQLARVVLLGAQGLPESGGCSITGRQLWLLRFCQFQSFGAFNLLGLFIRDSVRVSVHFLVMKYYNRSDYHLAHHLIG